MAKATRKPTKAQSEDFDPDQAAIEDFLKKPVTLFGKTVRSITPSSMAMLYELDLQLVQGVQVSELKNPLLEILSFIWVHAEEEEKVFDMIFEDSLTLKKTILRFGQGLEIDSFENAILEIIGIMQRSMSGKTEPITSEEEDRKAEVNEDESRGK
jgi:hypothetical protein